MGKRAEEFRGSTVIYNYDREFQTEGALTLKDFADKAKDICRTESNSLSANCRECTGWYSRTKWDRYAEVQVTLVSYDCQFVVDPSANWKPVKMLT